MFSQPEIYRAGNTKVTPTPGTQPGDCCLLLSAEHWCTFSDVSLWVEALCIHEWCRFTERVEQEPGRCLDLGDIYELLTSRPENRRPLNWERNHIEILLLEGATFICPWTEQPIMLGPPYDIDHILPVAIALFNELWNLIPANTVFNQHIKHDRLSSHDRLLRVEPHLVPPGPSE